MTLEKAKQIITEIAAARRKWGKQANPPYKLDVIMDALVAIGPALEVSGGPSPEEVTKLRRQLAACQNREKGRKHKPGTTAAEIMADGIARDFQTSQILSELSAMGFSATDIEVEKARAEFNAKLQKDIG